LLILPLFLLPNTKGFLFFCGNRSLYHDTTKDSPSVFDWHCLPIWMVRYSWTYWENKIDLCCCKCNHKNYWPYSNCRNYWFVKLFWSQFIVIIRVIQFIGKHKMKHFRNLVVFKILQWMMLILVA
jgi:hypothetical protein